MLRTASLLPLLQGFRHWASTPDVSLRRCQSATGPPDSYPDRTYTGRRRRAYEHEDQLPDSTASPLALLDALHSSGQGVLQTLRELPEGGGPCIPAAPFLALTFSNAAMTTCLEISYGFEDLTGSSGSSRERFG